MSQNSATDRKKFATEVFQSDSSTDLSITNNKERMKTFKTLSLKGNSIMEHLFSGCRDKPLRRQASMLYHSQKWDFNPIQQKTDNDDLTGSTRLENDNPFFRAKQNFLNKQKVSAHSGQIKKYIDEPQRDFEPNHQKTTFRLLKKGSANQPLGGYLRREL